jgi:hypothetical protein
VQRQIIFYLWGGVMSELNDNVPSNDQMQHQFEPHMQTASTLQSTTNDEPVSWWMIWEMALFHPSEETYKKIAAQKKKNKFWFVLAPSGLMGVFSSVIMAFFMVFIFAVENANTVESIDPSESTLAIIIISAVMGVFVMIFLLFDFFLTTGYYYLVGKIFGGKAAWDQILMLMVAIYQPLMVASFFLGFIPFLNVIALAIPVYLTVIITIAIKVANDISWIKAIFIAVIIPIVLFALIYGFIFMMALIPFFQQAITTMQQTGGLHSF